MAIVSNIQGFLKDMDKLDRYYIPELQRRTVNDIAFDIKAEAEKAIRRDFHHGNKLAYQTIMVKKANKDMAYNKVFEAEVYISDWMAWKHNALTTLGLGGDRKRKAFERRMIRSGYLKKHEIVTPENGKVHGSVYTQILSQFHIFHEAGYMANETLNSFRKKQKRRNYRVKRYMIVTTDKYAYTAEAGAIKKRKTGLAPGIYVKKIVSGKATHLRILKIGQQPHYKKMFHLDSISTMVYEKRADYHMKKNYDYLMKKLVKSSAKKLNPFKK